MRAQVDLLDCRRGSRLEGEKREKKKRFGRSKRSSCGLLVSGGCHVDATRDAWFHLDSPNRITAFFASFFSTPAAAGPERAFPLKGPGPTGITGWSDQPVLPVGPQ